MTRRCAVYTRKSSEEGLEQDFNSLHAQRDACEAYIKSQASERWKVISTPYDDGGLSGGNMERPGLKQLLEDIRARRVDIVVVYKVDRLTRSLADFAKMMEVFEANSISFVSVTQQFNTTSSMGRLTLNVLLSFAQFERELTGERIRDKVAASKKKGIWMGGPVPLGYNPVGRKLVVCEAEAALVRHIFDLYLEIRCVRRLKIALDREGAKSKARVTSNPRLAGNRPFHRGSLYTILRNPIYLGELRHKGILHKGLHDAFVDRNVWEEAQRILASGNGGRRRGAVPRAHVLVGLLFDEQGEPLRGEHAVKKGKRYRYYVSTHVVRGDPPRWRLPAVQIEPAVRGAVLDIVKDEASLTRDLQGRELTADSISGLVLNLRRAAGDLETGQRSLAAILKRVDLQPSGLQLTICVSSDRTVQSDAPILITRSIPMLMRRRGVEMRLILEGGRQPARVDETMIRAVARARSWLADLCSGRARSHLEIAAREGITAQYVNQLLPLGFLAPEIVEAIVNGRQPAHLSTHDLMTRLTLPVEWAAQHRLLGVA